MQAEQQQLNNTALQQLKSSRGEVLKGKYLLIYQSNGTTKVYTTGLRACVC